MAQPDAPVSSLLSGTYTNITSFENISLTSTTPDTTIYYRIVRGSEKKTYTSTNAQNGDLLQIPSGTTSVTVKLWGAGGTGNVEGNPGGAGGYTEYKFQPQVNMEYLISVGNKGNMLGPSGGTILAGGNSGVGSAGDASCLIQFDITTQLYTLMAVAGGGGSTLNGNITSISGAGGGSSGQSSTIGGVYGIIVSGGSDGKKGTTPDDPNIISYLGEDCTLTSSAINEFGGNGNQGIGLEDVMFNPGGGGYGAGSSVKYVNSTNRSGGSGGGGLVNTSITGYVSGSTQTGSYNIPPNTTDADYVTDAGKGGDGENGNDGLIVVKYTINKNNATVSNTEGTLYNGVFSITDINSNETFLLKAITYDESFTGSTITTYTYTYTPNTGNNIKHVKTSSRFFRNNIGK